MRKVVHDNELCFRKHQATMENLVQPTERHPQQPTEKPLNISAPLEDAQDNGIKSVCW